jgi:hypothetical protein
MIPYETFPMHEKIKEERFFLIKKEFSIPYTESRMKLTDFNDDFDCFDYDWCCYSSSSLQQLLLSSKTPILVVDFEKE